MWKPARSVFEGGTKEAKALKNSKVKVRRPLSPLLYSPINQSDETASLTPGLIGLVANTHPDILDMILLAFPTDHSLPPTTVEDLAHRNSASKKQLFFVVMVNWITFREQFFIEI